MDNPKVAELVVSPRRACVSHHQMRCVHTTALGCRQAEVRVEVKSPRSKRRQLYRSLLHDGEPDFGHEEHPGWTKEVGNVSSKLDEKEVIEEKEGSKGSKLTNAAQRDECLCHGSFALSLVSN